MLMGVKMDGVESPVNLVWQSREVRGKLGPSNFEVAV